jgi:hypothetical protein
MRHMILSLAELPLASVLILMQSTVFAQQPGASTIDSLTRQSTFIFRGTVEKIAASTMPAVPASESTAAVRVDELIDAPGAPPDLAGKSITVKLLQPGSVKAGEQWVFFAKGWLFGNSLAVIEVGRVDGTTSAQTVRGQVGNTRNLLADQALQNRIATAEAVVLGTVTSVRPAPIPHLKTEHDPDWYEARLTIQSVIKGRLPGPEVTVLFPHTDDVMWRTAPRFAPNQQGIWLLHRNQARLPGIENRFTALDPLDFRPTDELDRVRRLGDNLK